MKLSNFCTTFCTVAITEPVAQFTIALSPRSPNVFCTWILTKWVKSVYNANALKKKAAMEQQLEYSAWTHSIVHSIPGQKDFFTWRRAAVRAVSLLRYAVRSKMRLTVCFSIRNCCVATCALDATCLFLFNSDSHLWGHNVSLRVCLLPKIPLSTTCMKDSELFSQKCTSKP